VSQPLRAELALIPLPRSITPTGGSCYLPQRPRWSGERPAIELLEGWLPKHPNLPDASLVFGLNRDRQDIHDEGYELIVEKSGVRATAGSPAGLVFAAQTLRQLAFSGAGSVPCVRIVDNPRFAWRGLMLDSARHFFPVDAVFRLLDLASLHKLNRFHWHLTDDQGWRIEIRQWPRLTAVGSIRKKSQVHGLPLGGKKKRPDFIYDDEPHGGFYSQQDVRKIVSHARDLGITVVPEIDLPGHMQAAIAAYPQLGNGTAVEVSSTWGISRHILNVEPETVRFLENVLEEVLELFPGPWIHLGGDEVTTDEWEKSPFAVDKARQLGFARVGQLQGWLVQHFARWLADRGRALIGWDEILATTGRELPQGTVLMSWRGESAGVAAARGGSSVIMTPTSHTYFDYPQSPGRLSMKKVYQYEPVPLGLESAAARNILGSQGQLWSEWIPDQDTLDRQAFPRLCALSEVLWSPPESRNWERFRARLPRHLGLLDSLGVQYYR